ncbi:MAG: hypothetical protein HPY65_00705 [Syntrophaceae bacterium]|nr:hypothetical protein [Syntrophaceae bacterium]
MGRPSKKSHSKPKPPPYVPFRWDILNSSAYKRLIPSAAKLLPYFLGKVKCRLDDPALYATQFTFTFQEAEKCGFAKSTFRKSYVDLEAKGFAVRTMKGGLREGNAKVSNRFRLSKDWERYEGGIGKGVIERAEPDYAEIFINKAKERLTEKEVSGGTRDGKY